MLAAAALVWLAVMGVAVLGVFRPPARVTERAARWLIVGGGVVFPTIVLAGLLYWGLGLLAERNTAEADLRITVQGERWWWRVTYERPRVPADDDPQRGRASSAIARVVSANEIRLPAGEPVEFVLHAQNVIHSFWIPSVAGKMDMIPGRETRLVATATRPGVYGGVCAEFCGTAHALMRFAVVVEPKEAFETWLRAQAAPARKPLASAGARGADLFVSSGCGACHRVRGLIEAGEVGPDLTHLASRRTLAAGIAPMTGEALVRWIRSPQSMKPGALMPAYAMLPPDEIDAIAGFLLGLE